MINIRAGGRFAARTGSAATWLAAMALVAGTSTAGIFMERREAPKQLTKYDEQRLEAARRKRARRAAKKSPNASPSAMEGRS